MICLVHENIEGKCKEKNREEKQNEKKVKKKKIKINKLFLYTISNFFTYLD